MMLTGELEGIINQKIQCMKFMTLKKIQIKIYNNLDLDRPVKWQYKQKMHSNSLKTMILRILLSS